MTYSENRIEVSAIWKAFKTKLYKSDELLYFSR